MALTAGEILFLDTNVLLAATDLSRALHGEARLLLEQAEPHGLHLAVSGQVIREYLSVSTRPTGANGLGLSVHDAVSNVRQFLARAVLFEEDEAASKRTVELVDAHRIKGNRVHDAGIAGTMRAHHLRYIVTENVGDFSQFQGLEVLSLGQVASVLRDAVGP